jgi:hypothetical protein
VVLRRWNQSLEHDIEEASALGHTYEQFRATLVEVLRG